MHTSMACMHTRTSKAAMCDRVDEKWPEACMHISTACLHTCASKAAICDRVDEKMARGMHAHKHGMHAHTHLQGVERGSQKEFRKAQISVLFSAQKASTRKPILYTTQHNTHKYLGASRHRVSLILRASFF